MSDNEMNDPWQALLDAKLAIVIAHAKAVRNDDDEETLDQIMEHLTTTIECRSTR